jgi:hypothetical protein
MVSVGSISLNPHIALEELDRIRSHGYLESFNAVNGSDVFLKYCQNVSGTFRQKDHHNVRGARHAQPRARDQLERIRQRAQ